MMIKNKKTGKVFDLTTIYRILTCDDCNRKSYCEVMQDSRDTCIMFVELKKSSNFENKEEQ